MFRVYMKLSACEKKRYLLITLNAQLPLFDGRSYESFFCVPHILMRSLVFSSHTWIENIFVEQLFKKYSIGQCYCIHTRVCISSKGHLLGQQPIRLQENYANSALDQSDCRICSFAYPRWRPQINFCSRLIRRPEE